MRHKRWISAVLVSLVLALTPAASAYAATGYGPASDPALTGTPVSSGDTISAGGTGNAVPQATADGASGKISYIAGDTQDDGWNQGFREVNDPNRGNEGYMRTHRSAGNTSFDSDWDALQSAIGSFLAKYGVSDKPTPFEKEMAIIRGILAECTYEVAQDMSDYTAYSCLVNHRAQCAGYADAFLQIARVAMPETDVRYIHSASHAWNLIHLDGSWYHIDCTWADDDSGNVTSSYINLSDEQISGLPGHQWDKSDTGTPAVQDVSGGSLGRLSVQYYLENGTVETTPGTADFTIAADGSTTTGELQSFITETARGTADAGGHLVMIRVNGLSSYYYAARIRKLLQGVTDNLGRTVEYLLQPDYSYTDSGDAWTLRENGTLLGMLLR